MAADNPELEIKLTDSTTSGGGGGGGKSAPSGGKATGTVSSAADQDARYEERPLGEVTKSWTQKVGGAIGKGVETLTKMSTGETSGTGFTGPLAEGIKGVLSGVTDGLKALFPQLAPLFDAISGAAGLLVETFNKLDRKALELADSISGVSGSVSAAKAEAMLVDLQVKLRRDALLGDELARSTRLAARQKAAQENIQTDLARIWLPVVNDIKEVWVELQEGFQKVTDGLAKAIEGIREARKDAKQKEQEQKDREAASLWGQFGRFVNTGIALDPRIIDAPAGPNRMGGVF